MYVLPSTFAIQRQDKKHESHRATYHCFTNEHVIHGHVPEMLHTNTANPCTYSDLTRLHSNFNSPSRSTSTTRKQQPSHSIPPLLHNLNYRSQRINKQNPRLQPAQACTYIHFQTLTS
ncbi:hypothetical protein M758_1G201100 [Ceratodon purpureus]|nr:hypothetical protein M758_1G201100 [Ceratodon purpureus]